MCYDMESTLSDDHFEQLLLKIPPVLFAQWSKQ